MVQTRNEIVAAMVCIAVLLAAAASTAAADPRPGQPFESIAGWSVNAGHSTITLDPQALAALGISAPSGETIISSLNADASTLQVGFVDDQLHHAAGALATLGEALRISSAEQPDQLRIGNISISVSGSQVALIDGMDIHRVVFQSAPSGAIVDMNPATGRVAIAADLVVSRSFAVEVLQDESRSEMPVGHIEITADAVLADAQFFTPQDSEGATPRAGADVIVGALTGDSAGQPRSWGNSGGVYAYSVGTTSCNIGTVPLNWFDGVPNMHPVIGQNLFRLKTEPGTNYQRFEQIGQSWLKYGFCALQQGLCTSGCQPVCGGCCSQLGVNCSDPYTATRNGSFGNLGPKSPINPYLGTFPDPHALPSGATAIRGRLQALAADMNPSLNAGALYFVEGQYVAHDDSLAGNLHNNASWRRVNVGSSATNYPITWATGGVPGANTVREQPAIYAWAAYDAGVTILPFDVPSDGRFFLGHKVTDNGNGTWHYEYALFNLNSDRGAQFFSVAVPECVDASNLGFHDVFYHSGEPYDGTDWPGTVLQDQIIWATTQTHAQNPNANALRWATLYNFRFDAATPPTTGSIKIGLFKPGTPTFVSVTAQVPSEISCLRGDVNGDGFVNGADVARFVEILMSGVGTPTEKCAGDVQFIKDCEIGVNDVTNFVNCLIAGGC